MKKPSPQGFWPDGEDKNEELSMPWINIMHFQALGDQRGWMLIKGWFSGENKKYVVF